MKTVTYVGNFQPEFSTENDVRKAFNHLGWEVLAVQENQAKPRALRELALSSDLLLWTSTWDDAQPLDVTVETLWQCARAGVQTAALHLDTFWPTKRGGRNWMANPMWQCKYVFTADGDHAEQWRSVGVNHYWLPPGVRHDVVGSGEPQEHYACDVAFVGSDGNGYHEDVWPYRKELLTALREMCARRGWVFRNPGGSDPKIDRGHRLNDFYASAKVVVGDSLCTRHDKSKYWSDRVPETLGRGGFLVMPNVLELKRQFPHVPTYDWGDFDQLEEIITQWIAAPEARAQVIEEQIESVSVRDTYVSRVLTVLETVGL